MSTPRPSSCYQNSAFCSWKAPTAVTVLRFCGYFLSIFPAFWPLQINASSTCGEKNTEKLSILKNSWTYTPRILGIALNGFEMFSIKVLGSHCSNFAEWKSVWRYKYFHINALLAIKKLKTNGSPSESIQCQGYESKKVPIKMNTVEVR